MHPYETMFIIDPTLDDETIEATIARFEDLIKKHKGKITKVDRWGKRRLSYEIRGHEEGYYVLISFTADADAVAELNRVLHITDPVIRSMITRADELVAAEKAEV
ncbi:MAG: 30S ribosomal protein S6 [Actinobacteria bacterium]|nr:MAG: 30S ribosomal protein S6 [Actinomycetota bacterium]